MELENIKKLFKYYTHDGVYLAKLEIEKKENITEDIFANLKIKKIYWLSSNDGFWKGSIYELSKEDLKNILLEIYEKDIEKIKKEVFSWLDKKIEDNVSIQNINKIVFNLEKQNAISEIEKQIEVFDFIYENEIKGGE